MSDLISRQAAIKALDNIGSLDTDADREYARQVFEALPTAEKKGEWIPVVDGNYIIWECSECHVESEAWTDFCPICGSRNIEETDEEAYEEALEKFLQNPKTYTLDEVENELGLTAEKKGKWVEFANEDGELDLKCSVCGEEQGFYFGYFNFCPNCGARMEDEHMANLREYAHDFGVTIEQAEEALRREE